MTQGFNFNFNPISNFGNNILDILNQAPGTRFQLGESGLLRPSAISHRFAPAVTTSTNLVENLPVKSGVPVVQQNIPYDNIYTKPRLMLTTSGKPIPDASLGKGIPVENWAGGVYSSKQSINKPINTRLINANAAMKGVGKVGGATAAFTAPTAILSHRKAIKYYDDILRNPNSTPEQKQLAMAMRTKEQVQMLTEGFGAPIATAEGYVLDPVSKLKRMPVVGNVVSKHPKIANTIGGITSGTMPYWLSNKVGEQFDKGLAQAMAENNFQPYNGNLTTEVLDALDRFMNGKNNSTNGNKGKDTTNGGGKSGTGKGTTKSQAQAIANQSLSGQSIVQPSEQANEQANIQAINDYVQQLKDINQPYVDALQNYLNNYDRLARDNYARNRYWQGIASITGNPNWAKMANDYNPIANEANKINTIKTLQDVQAGNVNAINEIMGNLAMAEEMGLPPEAAFANKNLLTAMTMRDRNLTNREIAQLNNAIKLQVALQNAQNRLAVQNLRNQGGMTNALIYAGQYGQPAPGLNAQGTPANNQDIGLQQILQNAQKQNNR